MITMLTSTCPAMYAYPQLRQVTTLVWWERMPLVRLCRPICTLHSPAMLLQPAMYGGILPQLLTVHGVVQHCRCSRRSSWR